MGLAEDIEVIPNEYDQMIAAAKATGCVLCRANEELQFHHIHPREKRFLISGYRKYRPIEVFKREIDKCAVLCEPCHRAIHGTALPSTKVIRKDLYVLFQMAAVKQPKRTVKRKKGSHAPRHKG